MVNNDAYIAKKRDKKKRSISIIICIMVTLNLYGQYLQIATGIDSLLFTIIPLALLILLTLPQDKTFTVDKKIFIPCAICFAISALHMCVNYDTAAVKNMVYIIIFLLVSKNSNMYTWNYLKRVIIMISVIMSIDALTHVPYLLSGGYNIYNIRLYTLLDKSYYSLVLTFAIGIILIDILKKGKKHNFFGFFLVLLFSIINIFVFQAKSSLVGIISMVFILFLVDYKLRKKIIIYGTVLIVSLIVYYSINPDKIPKYIITMFQQLSGTLDYNDRDAITYIGRREIYELAFKVFLKNPILGIGFGNYAKYYNVRGVVDFESSWLMIIVEGGLIYTISHIFILINIFVILYQNLKNRDTQSLQMIIIFILYIVFNCQNDYISVMYWIFLGIMYSTKYYRKVIKSC